MGRILASLAKYLTDTERDGSAPVESIRKDPLYKDPLMTRRQAFASHPTLHSLKRTPQHEDCPQSFLRFKLKSTLLGCDD